MKKFIFAVGIGLGFILGSKAGPGPYEKLEETARSLRRRPDVDEVVERAKATASAQANGAVEKVSETLPSTPSGMVV
jgi:hypothetical protein